MIVAAAPGWYALYYRGEKTPSGQAYPPTFRAVVAWLVRDGKIIGGIPLDDDARDGLIAQRLCEDDPIFLRYLPPPASAEVMLYLTGSSPLGMELELTRSAMHARAAEYARTSSQ